MANNEIESLEMDEIRHVRGDDGEYQQGLSSEHHNESKELIRNKIIGGNVEYLEQFLSNGGRIKGCFKKADLEELYKSYLENHHFCKMLKHYLKKDKIENLDDVDKLIEGMIRGKEFKRYGENFDEDKIFQDLMIWSILEEKHDFAKFFWNNSEEGILMALIATMFYNIKISMMSYRNVERNDELKKWKDYFEGLAIKLLDEIYNKKPEIAVNMITQKNEMWENKTFLEIAYFAKDKKFISNAVCQISIKRIWFNGIKMRRFRWIFQLFLFFLPCLLWRHIRCQCVHTCGCSGTCLKKYWCTIRKFYKAPQTKFFIYLLTKLGFLLYFSAVLLYLIRRDEMVVHEYVYIGYLCIRILDILIPIVFESMYPTMIELRPFKIIVKIVWILLHIAAVGLGLSRDSLIISNRNWHYKVAKTFYSLLVGIEYLTLIKLSCFHHRIGPKVEMIRRMIIELFFYSMILLPILLTYGITSQAMHYTENTFSWYNVRDIFKNPYWALFGELNLEDTIYLNFCKASNVSLPTNCPELNYVVDFLYAAYTFVGIILLLSVLIATFSYIVENVHENSIQVWNFSMYELVIDFKRKPILPYPFSLIIYVGMFIKYCIDKCIKKSACRNKAENSGQRPSSYLVEPNMEDQNNLEVQCQKLVIRSMKEEKLSTVNDQLNTMYNTVEDMRFKFTNMEIKFLKMINRSESIVSSKSYYTGDATKETVQLYLAEQLNDKIDKVSDIINTKLNELIQKSEARKTE